MLAEQAKLDVASLEAAVGKSYTAEQKKLLIDTQTRAYKTTFVTWGATNPAFVDAVTQVFGDDAKQIQDKVTQLS